MTEEMTDPPVKDTEPEPDEDLEDGEIEDDDDDDVPPPSDTATALPAIVEARGGIRITPPRDKHRDRSEDKEKVGLGTPDGNKHKKKHLTEAEKSVMKLHKLERMEREKRGPAYRREECVAPTDDYAICLEKALAKVLRKDEKTSADDEKLDDEPAKRARKRKRRNKPKKDKRTKLEDSPKNPEDDIEHRSPERIEPYRMNDGSSDSEASSSMSDKRKRRTTTVVEKHGENKNRRHTRDRSRERSRERNLDRPSFKKLRKRNVGICLYYLQGKCNDTYCQYSHDCVQPLKLELCKFYLLDCCAKGDKCLYMHSDFPCKYFHTGIPCPYADDCKFAHGGPLPESVKQILFKHIETAPKEILGNFPRLSRENAHMMITQAQKNLEMIQAQGETAATSPEKKDDKFFEDANFEEVPKSNEQTPEKKEKRNRRSRWQDADPDSPMQQLQLFHQQQKQQQQELAPSQDVNMISGYDMSSVGFNDQDLRLDSNGDIDLRAISAMQTPILPTEIINPNMFASRPPPIQPSGLNLQLHQTANFGNAGMMRSPPMNPFVPPPIVDIEKYKKDAASGKADKQQISSPTKDTKDVDYRVIAPQDIDLRENCKSPIGDVDMRLELPPVSIDTRQMPPQLQPPDLTPDEEENALQIDIQDEPKPEPVSVQPENYPPLHKVQRDLFARIQNQQKLNTPLTPTKSDSEEPEQIIDWYSDDEDDDNKLTIEHDDEEDTHQEKDADTKTNYTQSDSPAEPLEHKGVDLSKINISAEVSKLLSTIQQSTKTDPRTNKNERESRDPRLARMNSIEDKVPQKSIYEQHSGSSSISEKRIPDIELNDLNISFKGMANYTPATEIDGSINNHPVMTYKVYTVEIPKPDYTSLRLSASDAHNSGDPRLKKIFRLSIEEKDSPASPSGSPEHKPSQAPAPRVDPRRKRAMEQQQQDSQLKEPSLSQPSTYAQQLTTLQSSPFYQSLTSKQKLMLNQELANRNDQTGTTDPIISAMLSNLGLQAITPNNQHTAQQAGQALNIINNLQSFAPQNALLGVPLNPASIMAAAPPNLGQGLLGPAPGHIPDFQMNFDPRNGAPGALLGNAPNVNFQGDFPPVGVGGNYQDEFFDNNYQPPMINQPQQQQQQQRGNMNRDRNNRRGRNNNNNRNRNFFRQNNRNRNNKNSPGPG